MNKNGWTLIKEDGTRLTTLEVESFKGLQALITGGEPPHREGTTGRVYVRAIDDETGELNDFEMSYYPSVFNLKWIKD